MKRITITICLCMIAAVLCTLQLCSTKESYHDVKGELYWRQQNEKREAELKAQYQQSVAVLQKKNDSLLAALGASERKLKIAKMRLHQSELSVVHLAEKDSVCTDTTQQLADCDSLKAEVLKYMSQADSVQAYCDSTVSQLKQSLVVQDSLIKICNQSYEAQQKITEDNLRREQRLTDELQKEVRRSRRKSIQNKFLAGGLLVLSGIAASLLLNGRLK